MKRHLALAAAAALVGMPGIAGAQELSTDEIKARLLEQIEVFRAAREDGLGAARGLEPIGLAPAAESDPGASVSADAAPPPVLTLPAKTDAAVAAVGAETAQPVHWIVPEETEVNLRVRFAFDSAALEESERVRLREVCAVLEGPEIAQLRIVGHTDASGSASYNQQLSVLRAEEVRRFFVNECGVEASRLEAIGVGEQFPYDADPFAGANRRVELQALS